MEPDFAINDLVEVKAPGIRLKHRGRVVNRFARSRLLYAVQFPDNCVGYFERSDLKHGFPISNWGHRQVPLVDMGKSRVRQK